MGRQACVLFNQTASRVCSARSGQRSWIVGSRLSKRSRKWCSNLPLDCGDRSRCQGDSSPLRPAAWRWATDLLLANWRSDGPAASKDLAGPWFRAADRNARSSRAALLILPTAPGHCEASLCRGSRIALQQVSRHCRSGPGQCGGCWSHPHLHGTFTAPDRRLPEGPMRSWRRCPPLALSSARPRAGSSGC